MTSASLKHALRGVVASSAVAVAVVVGAPAAHAADAPAITDQYLFDTSLAQFGSIRTGQPYAGHLVWSSDACLWSALRRFGAS